jgi:hypothetical protein
MSDNGTQPAGGANAPVPTDEDLDKLWNDMQETEDAKASDKSTAEVDPHDISTETNVDDKSSAGGGGQPASGASVNDGGGKEPKQAPPTAPVGKTPEGGSSPTPDVLANATPEIRAAFEAERQARLRAEIGSRSNAGRLRQMQEQLERLKGSVVRAADNQAPVSETLTQELAEFPEVAGPLKKAVGQIEARIAGSDTVLKAQIESQELEIANGIAAQLEVLDGLVPGWEDKYAKGGSLHAEYARWANDEAPGRLRKIIAENDKHVYDARGAALVFQAFEDYRAAQNPPAEIPAAGGNGQSQELSQRRSAQLDAAAHPQNSRRPPTLGTVPKDVDDPEAHWNELEANDPDERRWAERGRGRRR